MEKNKKRDTVIYTKDITESQLNEFKQQYNKIPTNWLRRFEKDNWQLAFTTDITISGNANQSTFLVLNQDEQRVWINVKIADISSYPVYRAFLFYMQTEYGAPTNNQVFEKICNNEKDLLSKIIGADLSGVLPEEIFSLLFIQMLEYPQIAQYDLSKTCSYVKKWLNEDIFKIRTSILPEYLKIGVDVTEAQIFEIIRGWQNIPIGLKERFLKSGWKIFLTNSREWRNDKNTRHLAGYITNETEEISIKASLKDLDMTLYHEFGHYMYILTENTTIRKFYNAYLKEKEIYFNMYNDEYGISNIEEYFAEVFAHYTKHPEQIKKKLPKSFEIIDSVTKNINNRSIYS